MPVTIESRSNTQMTPLAIKVRISNPLSTQTATITPIEVAKIDENLKFLELREMLTGFGSTDDRLITPLIIA